MVCEEIEDRTENVIYVSSNGENFCVLSVFRMPIITYPKKVLALRAGSVQMSKNFEKNQISSKFSEKSQILLKSDGKADFFSKLSGKNEILSKFAEKSRVFFLKFSENGRDF